MDYHDKVSKIFDYFQYKIYKNGNFKLDLSKNNQRKQIDNFLTLAGQYYGLPSIGVNFLIDYFCFSFEYWSSKVTNRKISLNWIIGPKTFNRFLLKNDSYQFFYQKFLLEYDIDITLLRQQLHEEEDNQAGLDSSEELEKVRFSDSARLFNCVEHTTLYNNKSGICLLCPFKSDCKALLKVKYPNTYKKRGYK